MSRSISKTSFPHFQNAAPILMYLNRGNSYYSPFNPYYVQKGSGSDGVEGEEGERDKFGHIYHASYQTQRGRGFGSIVRHAVRWLKPIAQRGLRTLVEEGLHTGKNILNDLDDQRGEVGKVVRSRLSEAKRRLKGKVKHVLTGGMRGKKIKGRGGKKGGGKRKKSQCGRGVRCRRIVKKTSAQGGGKKKKLKVNNYPPDIFS